MTEYKIKDLKPGMQKVDIDVKIDFLGEKRRGDGFSGDIFKIGFVTDDTGEIKMIFYNEDMKQAKEGSMIRIKNGFVTEWRGTLQLHPNKEEGVEFLK